MGHLLPFFIISSAAALAPALSCSSAGVCFASGLSTGAVLQRAPARASVYGSALGAAGALLEVTLASSDGTFSHTVNTTLRGDGTWKALLPAMPTGGNYSCRARCATCTGKKTAAISDLVFGDVFYAFGQSNMWLPLWFTYTRNSTLAAVLQGQYANIRLWRGGFGKVAAPSSSGNWVGPEGLQPGSADGNDALTNQWRKPLDVAKVAIRASEPWLWEFPATAFYFAMYLTDLLGADAPPIGLMTTPVGGTMVEEWTSPETQRSSCKNVTCMCMDSKSCDPYQPLGPACKGNSDLWYGNVQPFVNVTVKGFLYYQGVRFPHAPRARPTPQPPPRETVARTLTQPNPAHTTGKQPPVRWRQLRAKDGLCVPVPRADCRVPRHLGHHPGHHGPARAIRLCHTCGRHR